MRKYSKSNEFFCRGKMPPKNWGVCHFKSRFYSLVKEITLPSKILVLNPVILHEGVMFLPEEFGNVWRPLWQLDGACPWLLVGRGQGYFKLPSMHRIDPPPTKTYPTLNVKVEKSCFISENQDASLCPLKSYVSVIHVKHLLLTPRDTSSRE